jgi:hypothetical protein
MDYKNKMMCLTLWVAICFSSLVNAAEISYAETPGYPHIPAACSVVIVVSQIKFPSGMAQSITGIGEDVATAFASSKGLLAYAFKVGAESAQTYTVWDTMDNMQLFQRGAIHSNLVIQFRSSLRTQENEKPFSVKVLSINKNDAPKSLEDAIKLL